MHDGLLVLSKQSLTCLSGYKGYLFKQYPRKFNQWQQSIIDASSFIEKGGVNWNQYVLLSLTDGSCGAENQLCDMKIIFKRAKVPTSQGN